MKGLLHRGYSLERRTVIEWYFYCCATPLALSLDELLFVYREEAKARAYRLARF
jgi:hypothetical protein